MHEIKYALKSADQPVGVFRSLIRFIIHVLLDLVRPRFYIVDDQPDLLVLDANGYTIVANKPEQTVRINHQMIAIFRNIEAIHILHRVRAYGDRKPESWTVILKMEKRPDIRLGKSEDSMETSIAAAHLSTLIERPVVVFKI